MKQADEVEQILQRLRELFPEPGTVLNFTTPFELLVAAILSAQCTDVQVNKITAVLFTFAVDTHVFRVANRLGLAAAGDVRTTEEQLMQAVPERLMGRCPSLADFSWPGDLPGQKSLVRPMPAGGPVRLPTAA